MKNRMNVDTMKIEVKVDELVRFEFEIVKGL